jgi:SAM-dependent methyltransferase
MGLPDLGEIFFDIHKDLPREGPGTDEATLRALAMCAGLTGAPDILDVGCGPGMQTVALARATGGNVTGVDMHEPFLVQLAERAAAAGVEDRIATMRADMAALPFEPGSFDLVWSEGAAYIMGFVDACEAWRPLIRPGGYLMVSQAVWLVPDPPPELVDLFGPQTDMADVAGTVKWVRGAGYEIIGHFTLDDEAWWTHYMTPLAARIPMLQRKYAGDEAALAVIDEALLEDRLRRERPDAYSYEYIVARPV